MDFSWLFGQENVFLNHFWARKVSSMSFLGGNEIFSRPSGNGNGFSISFLGRKCVHPTYQGEKMSFLYFLGMETCLLCSFSDFS
jgi:hypothetical protein